MNHFTMIYLVNGGVSTKPIRWLLTSVSCHSTIFILNGKGTHGPILDNKPYLNNLEMFTND